MAKFGATTALAVDVGEELGRRLELGVAQAGRAHDGVDALVGRRRRGWPARRRPR